MGDVEVVGLGAGGGNVGAAGLLHVLFALGDAGEIVADADDFGDAAEETVEGLDHGGRKLDGPLLTGDVRGVGVAHEPVDVGVEPNVEGVGLDGGYDGFGNSWWQKFLIDYGLEVGLDQDATVEGCQGLSEFQGIDEHGHATGRASAGDGEFDSGFAEI